MHDISVNHEKVEKCRIGLSYLALKNYIHIWAWPHVMYVLVQILAWLLSVAMN